MSSWYLATLWIVLTPRTRCPVEQSAPVSSRTFSSHPNHTHTRVVGAKSGGGSKVLCTFFCNLSSHRTHQVLVDPLGRELRPDSSSYPIKEVICHSHSAFQCCWTLT